MAVSISIKEFAPFGKCVAMDNGDAELLVTVDCGPRVISYKKAGGENLFFADVNKENFADDPRIKETFGADIYWFKGGHRLWGTPEDMPMTYVPDDKPVAWEETADGVVFKPEQQVITDWQYVMTVKLAESGTDVKVKMEIINMRDEVRETGAWGITQMKAGGTIYCPLNVDMSLCPLPDKLVTLWPYCNLKDPRFDMDNSFISLHQEPGNFGPAFKFGTNNTAGWVAYANDGGVFVKRFAAPKEGCKYPDFGCNYESYTDGRMLEVECLGEMKFIGKGESVTLEENWFITDKNDPLFGGIVK